jgi:hypothetical protein
MGASGTIAEAAARMAAAVDGAVRPTPDNNNNRR